MKHRAKPPHLAPEYGAQFEDAAVARAYHTRPPYPDALIEALLGLLPEHNRRVLDLGCGTGDLAVPLAQRGANVDAVDPSAAMLEAGQQRDGAGTIRWFEAASEDVALEGPYGLIVAGESLHWMDWDRTFARIQHWLDPDAVLAIAQRGTPLDVPWGPALQCLLDHHSTNRDFAPYDLIALLQDGGFLRVPGDRRIEPVAFVQPIDDYVESFHSRNGFSRARMPPDSARAFDDAVRELVSPHSEAGMLQIPHSAKLTWGRHPET